MHIVNKLRSIIGEKYVLTGTDTNAWSTDWTGKYSCQPMAVVRPADSQEISKIIKLANEASTPVVPIAGGTGLTGGTYAQDAILVSVDRLNKIMSINVEGRTAVVESGVILASLHKAADDYGLIFPLTFGAKGSARIGGCLANNAGGSNVLRYGNTRDLCLGIEVVLGNGDIMNLMTELHKDNTGYNLRNLLIGSEGTLGIITAAVLKLAPKPRAYATAIFAASSLPSALRLLNHLKEATNDAVEAFEFMPGNYVEAYLSKHSDAKAPFEQTYDINVLVEIGATAPRDALVDADGNLPVVNYLQTLLAEGLEDESILNAVIASSESQRLQLWAMREAAAELAHDHPGMIGNDITLPLANVESFLQQMDLRLKNIDHSAKTMIVAHLGDGNIHYAVHPSSTDKQLRETIIESVEKLAISMGGSFSAEHGIGLSKLGSMKAHKDPIALQVMRNIKHALDPNNILNPGKVIPES
ncbi:MAG: FAD/FMN-containing dehydrogenase [Parasphingorhabdus sp.]|jgi:FAD/FMN-containing dehydrogenase